MGSIQVFDETGCASRIALSKKVESKKLFFDCVRKPDLGFSRNRPFSTDKSDRIRIDRFLVLGAGAMRTVWTPLLASETGSR